MVHVEEIREKQTNGINCDVDTDDVIAKLQKWDDEFGIETSDIANDSITVTFKSLPDDIRALANEIYKFCPDTVDQHYGCMGEMIEVEQEMGEDVDPELLKFVEGVDLSHEDAGLVLLARALEQTKSVNLWWD